MGFMQQLSLCVTVALLFLCTYDANGAVTQRPVVQDPAFVGAGNEAGLRVWRIEASLNAVPGAIYVYKLCSQLEKGKQGLSFSYIM